MSAGMEGALRGEDEDEKSTKLRALFRLRARLREDRVGTLVSPGLFVGSLECANNSAWIEEMQITHVITVIEPNKFSAPGGAYQTLIQLVVPIPDAPSVPLGEHFPVCFEFIKAAFAR